MMNLKDAKELECLETPLLLFNLQLPSGDTFFFSTYAATVGGVSYAARVTGHKLVESRFPFDETVTGASKLVLTLSNIDGLGMQVERASGWKGAKLTTQFLFYDLVERAPATDPVVLFTGIADPPEEITDTEITISFFNRLNLKRVILPETRIEAGCPWIFPSSPEERQTALDGGSRGKYSLLFRCGYSADRPGGCGNLQNGLPYETCNYSRADCELRGMFSTDAVGNTTGRFGGLEFLPASILVRGYGERNYRASEVEENTTRYSDVVPLVYGTAWYRPPIVFARNDGNLTRMQVLLGAGEVEGIRAVLVNDIEVPAGRPNTNMTATGWYEVVSAGDRNGKFDSNFADGSGNPLGDPYGSLAYLSLVVPNRISDGRPLPQVQILIDGMKLPRYSQSGEFLDEAFTSNPAWVILDMLRRSGWEIDEIDLTSFASTAEYFDQLEEIQVPGSDGMVLPRCQTNLVVRSRRSASDLVRSVQTSASLFLPYDSQGRLSLRPETTLASQHPTAKATSNATEPLNGGWPAYEFGDGTNGFSGILREIDGRSSLRIWSRPTSETPNRYTVEFQDAFNEFQQDSVSLVDTSDVSRAGQEVPATLAASGLPHASQAIRAVRQALLKSTRGNLYAQFRTSARAIGVQPGDIITLTYASAGFDRQPFRVVQMTPDVNHETVRLTAQIHDDDWYNDGEDSTLAINSRQRVITGPGIPRPLCGAELDVDGHTRFSIEEVAYEGTDGTPIPSLRVRFTPPNTNSDIGMIPPRLSLDAVVTPGAGALKSGQRLFYAATCISTANQESGLSFLVQATTGDNEDTYSVTLNEIHVGDSATGVRIYRGTSPLELLLISEFPAGPSSFTDTGFSPQLIPPPDPNYNHANFYWRTLPYPETAVEQASSQSLTNSQLLLPSGEYESKLVVITRGTGRGQERVIRTNSETMLEVTQPWATVPDTTSLFAIADPTWHFGATSYSDQVEFEIPNLHGATIQVSGRAANANDVETSPTDSPWTNWIIGGSAGEGLDALPPPKPYFALELGRAGHVSLTGVSFETLENTLTISSGTLTLHHWDELQAPTTFSLAAELASDSNLVSIAGEPVFSKDDLFQVDGEILRVVEDGLQAGQYLVEREVFGSAAAVHPIGSAVYSLVQKVFVVPFPKTFFTTTAAEKLDFPIRLPGVRISAAEFFVTNEKGPSEVAFQAFTNTADYGLRTLEGGQFCLQVEGHLRVETNATVPVVADNTMAVRDLFAQVQEAASSGDIEIVVRRNGDQYAELTIPAGTLISALVSRFGVAALQERDVLSVDIVAAGDASSGFPGRDLTVTIRT